MAWAFSLAVLAVAGCRSDKTPELTQRFQLGGVALRTPAWRPVGQDGNPAHGMLRLRPRRSSAFLGLSLRWDADAGREETASDHRALAAAAVDVVAGHLAGELRLPGTMIASGEGAPIAVAGHPASAHDLTVEDSRVTASAVVWRCPETGRRFLFELHFEGDARLRRKLAHEVLGTIACHGAAGSGPAAHVPALALAEVPAGAKPGAAPPGWSRLELPDGQVVLTSAGSAIAERRGSDPEVARRQLALAAWPALRELTVERVDPAPAETEAAGHGGVLLTGRARDLARPGAARVRFVARRWDCPLARKTFVAFVLGAPDEAASTHARRGQGPLWGVRCHGQ